jgi:hypothetical protein
MKELIQSDRISNLVKIMKDESDFDYSLIREILLKFSLDAMNYIREKVTELISMNYMMKNVEIDKLYVFLIIKLFEFFYDKIIKIETFFYIDFQEMNIIINSEMIKVFEAYYNICFNQAVMNNKLNHFMEIYFFLLDISTELYTKISIDQNYSLIKYENGKKF